MNITKEEVDRYLTEVHAAIHDGRYRIAPRPKNQELYIDYILTDEDVKNVILSLDSHDFSEAVKNVHLGYPEEILYIFGKNITLKKRYEETEESVALYIKFNKISNQYLIVISFHKQEYPLAYKFR